MINFLPYVVPILDKVGSLFVNKTKVQQGASKQQWIRTAPTLVWVTCLYVSGCLVKAENIIEFQTCALPVIQGDRNETINREVDVE